MLTESAARHLATCWVQAWNAHDLEAILEHYAPEVVLISPIAAQLLNDPSGRVEGKTALQKYFERGLATYPDLKFDLLDVMWGISSLVLYYVNQKGTKAGEFIQLADDQKIIRVVANYGG